jgi:hypothetical protein
MNTFCCTLLAAASVGIGLTAFAVQPGGTRQIHVSTVVQTENGDRLGGIGVLSSFRSSEWLSTANGEATVDLILPSEVQVAYVQLTPGYSLATTDEQIAAATQRYDEVTETYSFSDLYRINIVDGVDQCSVVMTGFPAVHVSGRMVDSDAHLLGGSVMVRGAPNFQVLLSPMPFRVGGVRRGQAAELFLRCTDIRVLVVNLSPVQTLVDVDLGDVVASDSSADSTLHLTVPDQHVLRGPNGRGASDGVSLIRDDGGLVLSLALNDSDLAVKLRYDEADPAIPAGTYYVCPFGFTGTEVQLMLLDLARAHTNLDPFAVPKVVMVAGQTTTLQVQAVQADAAIRAAAMH